MTEQEQLAELLVVVVVVKSSVLELLAAEPSELIFVVDHEGKCLLGENMAILDRQHQW
jgi:hypothetical protein